MSRTASSLLTIALVGNPNTGKSTLFSALAGVRQRVGNYPGVTVEKKIGHTQFAGQSVELVDLPGTYSLAPRSPDEMVAVDVLLGRRGDSKPIDAVLSIVDASNLERNLYLVSQVLEMGLPTVVALNMTDIAADRGIEIDVPQLSQRLGVPVIAVQAHRRQNLDELAKALVEAASHPPRSGVSPFPQPFQAEVEQLQAASSGVAGANGEGLPRFLVERLLLDSGGNLQELLAIESAGPFAGELKASRQRLSEAGCPVPAVEAMSRYRWIAEVLSGIVRRPAHALRTAGDRIDRVLTNRWAGTLIFSLLMLLVFTSVFIAADVPMTLIDDGVGWLGDQVAAVMPEGALRSLIVDGIIGGVGGVVIFLPQIMILFFFIALLEDCGYMARAAYLMDKLMTRVGLSGKSFIPLLSSFACAIPGVMATRVIENRRDRLTTILIAPLMSCSARLPVYAILIGAFIPARSYLGGLIQLQGFTLFAMYLLGIVTAAIVALVLKRTLLRGPTPPFVLELPSYKWPAPRVVITRVLERAWGFLYRAGTLILAVSVIVWAMGYYPRDPETVEAPFQPAKERIEAQLEAATTDEQKETLAGQLAEVENDIAAAHQAHSVLGRMGKVIEPVVRPLGWDWRIGCAAIASFPAREVVMSVLGVIYNLGSVDVGDEEEQGKLESRLKAATWDGTDRPVYNIPVALSIMVFFALCAQCAATLAVIKRETNSWRWPLFTFGYMTVLAYIGALVTYQVGMMIGAG